MSRSLVSAAVVVHLFLAASSGAQQITRGPYLQRVGSTSIHVVWDQSTASQPEVKYGTGGAYTAATKSGASGTHHEVKLSGLLPDTSYSYAVFQGSTKLSSDLTLRTAVGAGTPFRFVVFGDTRSDPIAHKNVIVSVSLDSAVRFYINTGDLVSDGSLQSEWDVFFGIEQVLQGHIPLFPVIGNHDESSGDFTLYKKHFVLPDNAPDPEAYYSFDYGNSHFVVLDGHVNVQDWYLCALQLKLYDACFTPKQESWLKSDLQAASTKAGVENIFVLIHDGPYSSKAGRTGNAQMRDLLSTFKSSKVSMIISGHDHYYEHGLSGNGLHYVVTGGGGAPLYSIGAPCAAPHTVIYNKSDYHYLVIDVNGKHIHVTAKTPTGAQLEDFSFGTPPPPGPDGGVDARADGPRGARDAAPGKDGGAPSTDSAVPQADGGAGLDDAVGCSCRVGGRCPFPLLFVVLLGLVAAAAVARGS